MNQNTKSTRVCVCTQYRAQTLLLSSCIDSFVRFSIIASSVRATSGTEPCLKFTLHRSLTSLGRSSEVKLVPTMKKEIPNTKKTEGRNKPAVVRCYYCEHLPYLVSTASNDTYIITHSLTHSLTSIIIIMIERVAALMRVGSISSSSSSSSSPTSAFTKTPGSSTRSSSNSAFNNNNNNNIVPFPFTPAAAGIGVVVTLSSSFSKNNTTPVLLACSSSSSVVRQEHREILGMRTLCEDRRGVWDHLSLRKLSLAVCVYSVRRMNFSSISLYFFVASQPSSFTSASHYFAPRCCF
jgi:predicted alpha/beta hydrolase family esterase